MTGSRDINEQRKEWISLLGSADPEWLEQQKKAFGLDVIPDFMVRPETGIIMMQARQDGAGPRFNLGEVTVSRCILKLDGVMGFAMVMGPDLRHAELAALFDAMLQMADPGPDLREAIVPELRRMQKDRRDKDARDVQSSKVEFFTMKRGE
ncbi:phosphonate C-P lyase system protein PhnG [Desulfobacter curvatus]|uniref:phosphonate C-P lyase system protein PhnG n=1 Tax=Desulfobacter curvatus TaxID=2290 RepID=UPI000375F396|nr:phosphonate C-P lyase system protein PhnG [Desulfobacter curvatus]